jgi:hypothetical protein
LLAGAQKVVKEFDGRLPEDPAVLEKEVPGIGRYSSGAISSIAYGVRAPVVCLPSKNMKILSESSRSLMETSPAFFLASSPYTHPASRKQRLIFSGKEQKLSSKMTSASSQEMSTKL